LHSTFDQGVIYSSIFPQACYQQPLNAAPIVRSLILGTIGTVVSATPIFTNNSGFYMLMDTLYVVKDMNQMAFTRVPEWCPSVNSPPSFKKPVYKEILVQMK
jgi:hypothetical protein